MNIIDWITSGQLMGLYCKNDKEKEKEEIEKKGKQAKREIEDLVRIIYKIGLEFQFETIKNESFGNHRQCMGHRIPGSSQQTHANTKFQYCLITKNLMHFSSMSRSASGKILCAKARQFAVAVPSDFHRACI